MPQTVQGEIGIGKNKQVVAFERAMVLKIGQRVLLYENTPEEIWGNPTPQNLSPRLYTVKGLTTPTPDYPYSKVFLRLHNSTGFKTEPGKKDSPLNVESGRYLFQDNKPVRFLLHTQINALVEGTDFWLSYDGRLT